MSQETKKEPIPEYDMSIMHTHFSKEDVNYPEIVREVGLKALKEERPHWDVIGKNPSICRKLYGLGSILNGIGLGFNFNDLDNHVWIKQLNTKTSRTMQVCLNCSSLKIDGRFIPYTDLKQ